MTHAPLAYVRETYGVPACIGRRIEFNGRSGVIAEDRGNYIGVNFDDDAPGQIVNLHPTERVTYLGTGPVRKPSRSQARYRRFVSADTGESFGEFLKREGRQPRKEVA